MQTHSATQAQNPMRENRLVNPPAAPVPSHQRNLRAGNGIPNRKPRGIARRPRKAEETARRASWVAIRSHDSGSLGVSNPHTEFPLGTYDYLRQFARPVLRLRSAGSSYVPAFKPTSLSRG